MLSDDTGTAGTTLEVISYFLRKRYAYLLDTGGTNIPGSVGKTQPDSQWVPIGVANNTYRIIGQNTEPNDNIPIDDPTREPYAEPDTDFINDATEVTQENWSYFQNQNHSPVITVPTVATINNTGLLYWSSPDLKIGPTSETDLQDTLADHCLTQMISGDEVGSYRVATSTPSGGTWSDKGQFMDDTWYYRPGGGTLEEGDYHITGWNTPGHANYQQTTVGDYRLYLKTANTTEPSSPDNYIRWDDTNNEIQLESSTDYSATAKLINDVYLNIIKRRHPVYTLHTTQTGTMRGIVYDYMLTLGNYSQVLSGPSGTGSEPYHDGVYTRTYEPAGYQTTATGPYYFNITGNRVPPP
jgi:hypothetical protein